MAGTREGDRGPSPLTTRSPCATSVRPTNAFVRFERGDTAQSIPNRFEQLVRRFPDKIAVKTTRDALTYAQLDALANRISHLILATRGSGNEPVALLFGQSALLVASIVGSLKAGKIYVPLDPLSSTPRNTAIMADSAAAVILTDTTHLDYAHEFAPSDVSLLNVDAMENVKSDEHPGLDLPSDLLAYLFYTSGSTGKPKGLADTHRNVLHNIMRYTNSLHICSDDRLTLLQSASFSGSVSSLFCALLNGATSFPFSLQLEGPDRMASWVSQEGITIYHSVPSIFRLLATGKHSYPALRIIRLEGDQASPRDIELYKAFFPDTCTLVNGLGATECGIVRQYFVTKDTPVPESIVPIGYAVEDMDLRLLDESSQPVGFECVGEIAVRSRYLAPGYWRRPELTQAAFLPDPHGGSERVYRTGDLGRMRTDGCVEYLGRKNFQLRIRGQWVEMSEVEKALRTLAAFKDVVVLTVEDNLSEPRLVAYLVPGESPPPEADELRRHLAQRLPVHMIPSAFVTLNALPLNPHGKVDRRALPAPRQERPGLTEPYVPPQNMLQLQLQKIWEEVLQVRPVGMRDSFFDLGGDSLHALNMIAQAEQATGKTIPPEIMLAGPTIEHLAGHINEESDKRKAPILEVQKGNSRRAFYFLHGDYMSGGYYCFNLARHLGPDRPFYAMPPCGANGYPAPDTYEDMAKIHIEALREKQPVGPYMLGGTCNGGLVAYEMARRLAAEGQRIDALILIAASVFNLRLKCLRLLFSPLGIFSKHAESRAFARLQPFWRALTQLPPAQRPAFVLSKVPRLIERLHDQMSGESENSQERTGKMDARSESDSRTAFRARLGETYHRIDRGYWPGPYPGKVTLFWWDGEDEGPDEAARWWSSVAGTVELHRFPRGNHLDFLTGHIEVVAERLRSCLNSAG
jgi:amino acid adenylation domain-containing protein